MSNEYLLLVAAYQDPETADAEFDALAEKVRAKEISAQGMILVAKDPDGTVNVKDTGDKAGRKGATWGSGVGLLVGLASPMLLGSVVVGAAGGAAVGKVAGSKVRAEVEGKVGEGLKDGTAVILAMFPPSERLAIEQALPGSPMKSIAEMDNNTVGELKDALADASGKFAPDRTVLPIPDRKFGGTCGRTLRDSVSDWSMIPGPQAPEDAPNVLIVLIDDAGFGNPSTFGGPVQTPTMTRVRDMGLTYNRSTSQRSARRRVRRCSRAATSTASGSDRSPSTRGPSRATRPPSPRAAQDCPGSCRTTATSREASGSGTSRPTTSRGPPDRSTTGRRHGDSTIGGASCPVQPASTTRSSPRTTRPSGCSRARTASSTTSRTTSRTRQSSGCTACGHRTRRSRG